MNEQGYLDRLARRTRSPDEQGHWRRSILDIYCRMRDKAKAGPYTVYVGGLAFRVLPNVYSPRFFSDTSWFARQLPSIVADTSLLEIGTGTGVIAAFCAQQGAQVLATDVNPDAVVNAKLNLSIYGFNVEVRQGYLYDPIRVDEKFDFIFWNHPFNNWDVPVEDMLLQAGVDHNYDGLEGYISGAGSHLKQKGRLLLGSGDTADWQKINRLAVAAGYRLDLITDTVSEEDKGLRVRYFICEFARSVEK